MHSSVHVDLSVCLCLCMSLHSLSLCTSIYTTDIDGMHTLKRVDVSDVRPHKYKYVRPATHTTHRKTLISPFVL